MKAHYLVQIDNPQWHYVKVKIQLKRPKEASKVRVFLPSWSPGSYLMREYARHVRWFEATQFNGEVLFHRQKAKGVWEIDWEASSLKKEIDDFEVNYEIYCKELTVRTSHVDASHAFLHGPSYLMGVEGQELEHPTIEFRFPALWSKLSTSLKEVEGQRDEFVYVARHYDELIDCPVEIGCHETDGFMLQGKAHHVAIYGETYPFQGQLKKDVETIVKTVAHHFGNDLPYEQYLFINHFFPKGYGGLEHLSSTALQFDGRRLHHRRDYLTYLSLVAHEYFHLWNVKRIRPLELGPFDYLNENYTSMLWLAEGLTSFMDDLFVYRSGLATLEEYLDFVKSNIEVYLKTPGRKYHSLEQSSFNAWVKLYRPDENSKNSSVSYYLKGGLVFMVLHSLLLEKGHSINDLLGMLWSDYKDHPGRGIDREGVYEMVKTLGGSEVLEAFSTMVETTQDIDLEGALKRMGIEMKFSGTTGPWLGVEWEGQGDRVIVKSVVQDSPAYKGGLNAGDEVLFFHGGRFLKEDTEKLTQMLMVDRPYELLVSRLGRLVKLELIPQEGPHQLKELAIVDRELAQKAFGP